MLFTEIKKILTLNVSMAGIAINQFYKAIKLRLDHKRNKICYFVQSIKDKT